MSAEELNAITPNDYVIRLTNYLESQIGKKFVWGETHCTALVFGSIDSIYDTNYYQWHKETHNVDSTERALELCESEETLEVFNDIGFMEIDLFTIKSGDVLYAKNDGYECCYVFTGSHFVSSRLNGVVEVTLYNNLVASLENKSYKVFTLVHK
tara:strand:- start:7680 stop:8141 length:462 start_codon:yes stop_codon:yes gene_type:complete